MTRALRVCSMPAMVWITVIIASAPPAKAHASGRQLHGGPLVGASLMANGDTHPGATLGAQLAWGATDAIRLFGTVEAPIGASVSTGRWRIAPGLSAGVAYALDALSVVPWIGVEVRGHSVLEDGARGPRWLIGAGGRVGIDWLARRYVGLTVQGAWSACLLDGTFSQLATVTVGARWTVDL
jgi:hypothetical protein